MEPLSTTRILVSTSRSARAERTHAIVSSQPFQLRMIVTTGGGGWLMWGVLPEDDEGIGASDDPVAVSVPVLTGVANFYGVR